MGFCGFYGSYSIVSVVLFALIGGELLEIGGAEFLLCPYLPGYIRLGNEVGASCQVKLRQVICAH